MSIKEYRLGELVTPKSLKRIYEKDWTNYGVPFLKVEDINKLSINNNVNFKTFISNGMYDELIKKYEFPSKGTILLTTGGTLGKVWKYDGRKCWFKDSAIRWLKNNENIILNKYLYFWFIKNNNYFTSVFSGSVMKIISSEVINNFSVKVPNLNIQQTIIDIIEPFENMLENLKLKLDKIQKIIKLIYLNSKSNQYIKLSKILFITKHKMILNYNEVLDLSSLCSNNYYNLNFKSTNDFKTNIYSIKEDQLYLSSIRPNLEKYGISWKNSNVLGTIICFDGDLKNKLNALSLFSQDEYKVYLTSKSFGTKMPVIDANIALNYDMKILYDNEIELIKKIHNIAKNLTKKIIIIKKIIKLLIDKYI